jgi:hypothetical protein
MQWYNGWVVEVGVEAGSFACAMQRKAKEQAKATAEEEAEAKYGGSSLRSE